MKERPVLLVTRHLSTPSRRTATSPETLAAGPSKLIAALDALVLNDSQSVNKDGKDDEDDSEVEIVAFGPVPIQPRKASRQGTRKPNLVASNEPERPIHSFFLRAGAGTNVKSTSRTFISSGSKTMTTQTSTRQAVQLVHPDDNSSTNVNAVQGQNRVPSTGTRPFYSYKDYVPKYTVVYTRHEEEADDLIAALENGPVGFDLEWRVLWARRANAANATPHNRRTAVVQIADVSGLILVIQVHGMSRFPKNLQELIENPDIPKLGANIMNDGKKLFEDYGILAKNLLELGALAHLADPAGGNTLAGTRQKYKNIISLAKLVEHYCEKSLDKNKALRMGNWEAVLDESQINYAANDAHCAFKIYDRLLELARENNVQLDNEIMGKWSSSVSSPYPKMLVKSASYSDMSMEVADSEPRQLQRHETMPNMPATGQVGMRPQQLRAYKYWHERGMSLGDMCVELSLKSKGYGTGMVGRNATVDENADTHALKASTVISYVIGALQSDTKLPFDMEKLRQLVQMDAGSWERHREWILNTWSDGRGVACHC
ncbi:hypothetical protein APHAL10511_007343 [Amanita phalloides]|nr:hypothetical protein APHAL10511_007343 [Amanita phalloides]